MKRSKSAENTTIKHPDALSGLKQRKAKTLKYNNNVCILTGIKIIRITIVGYFIISHTIVCVVKRSKNLFIVDTPGSKV